MSERSPRRLYLLRFIDAFAFAFAWLSLGLWAARTGGAAAFAHVTVAIYLAYPAAIWLVGPAAARFGIRNVARTSAALSGLGLSGAFVALQLAAPAPLLLTLIAAQSLAGSAAAELVKHGAARQSAHAGLSAMMVAYRAGFGAGGLAAGLLLATSSTTAVLVVGLAAAWASSWALLAASHHLSGDFSPKSRSHPLEWLRSDPAGNLLVACLSVSVAAGVTIAPGIVAARTASTALAGALAALVALGSLLGPHLSRLAERHPALYPMLAIAGAAALSSLHHPWLALLAMPAAAVAFDVHIVRQEIRMHQRYPDEPGAVAIPGVIWSLGVAAAALPQTILIDRSGVWPTTITATLTVAGVALATAHRITPQPSPEPPSELTA
jgi:hypothetical protein